MRIVDRIPYNAWKQRVDKGVRLVRFYGQSPQDLLVPENAGGSFVVSVLSDHHAPVVQQCSYAVTERCRLLMPFDPDEIARVNARDVAETERILAELQATVDEASAKEQSSDTSA